MTKSDVWEYSVAYGIDRGGSMNETTVAKDELLNALYENRKQHRATFEEALEVYRQRAIEELERFLDDAKHGRKITRAIGLIEPRDYTKEYDRAIRMLEMSLEDEITISAQDFAQFVMDDWAWKEAFTTSTSAYVATSR